MPPDFTALPQEIRDAILKLCLVVEGPINPYPAYYEDSNPFEKTNRKPDVALLTVNKSINAEASILFYGGNIWKFNWRPEEYPKLLDYFWQSGLPNDFIMLRQDQIWTIYRTQIRHITLDLDVRDLDATIVLQSIEYVCRGLPSETSSAMRVQEIHDDRCEALELIFQWKLLVTLGVQPKSAYINVKNLFCIN